MLLPVLQSLIVRVSATEWMECVSKNFPTHPCKNYCTLFSSDCISAQSESLSRLLCVRLSAKWGTEAVLFSYAWVYKSKVNVSIDNIGLYIDDSATSETTRNYAGLKDLEGPRLLNLKGTHGVSNMKYDQRWQSEKAQHMCWPFLKRIIWSWKGGLQVFKKIWQVASPLNVPSTCCNCNMELVFNFCHSFPF